MNSIVKRKEEYIISIILGISTFAIITWDMTQRLYSIDEDFTLVRNKYLYAIFLLIAIKYLLDIIREIIYISRVRQLSSKLVYNNRKLIMIMSLSCIVSTVCAFIMINNDRLIIGYIILFIAWNSFPRIVTNGVYTCSSGIIISNVFISNSIINNIDQVKVNEYEITNDSEKRLIKVYDKEKIIWINKLIHISS